MCIFVEVRGSWLIIAGITGIQIGRKKGIGAFGTWTMPSFLIVYVRRMLFMDRMAGILDGKGL
jgi:hypothetical protein